MRAQALTAGAVLALNSGSSSLKFGLLHVRPCGIDTLLSGEAERLGTPDASLRIHDGRGRLRLHDPSPLPDAPAALARIVDWLAQADAPAPQAIGHRIVHGGPRQIEHAVIDAQVLRRLEAAAPFAPLHLPTALALIDTAARRYPGLPQAACLDTCFHARMPTSARTLPLPRAWRAQGLQRYGFHGLSCESIVHQLGPARPGRLVIAHLGHGASLTAVRDGISVDTSMGLTPSGGVMMGTRSGDLDPGVLVHLMRGLRLDADAIEHGLDHHSGLIGISGLSADMRTLHEAAASSADARLAIDMFCLAVAKSVAGMAVALGGLDMLVFTGGIGEHDTVARAAIAGRLAWLGVHIDAARHAQTMACISPEAARCVVRVMPSQEDAQIARHTAALCFARV